MKNKSPIQLNPTNDSLPSPRAHTHTELQLRRKETQTYKIKKWLCHKSYRRDAHWLRGRREKSICPVDDDDYDYTAPACAGYYLRPIRRPTHFLQSSYVQLSLRDIIQVYWARIKAKEEEDPDPPMQFYSFSIFSFLGGAVIVGTLARTHHAKNLRS